MAGLGDTVAALRALKRKLTDDGVQAPHQRLMKETRGFGFNPGALRMFTYVPDDLPSLSPLVVVLHGCTQRAEAHASAAGWLTLADRLGFAVLAPEQEQANNPNRCFNWFELGDNRRDCGEAASIRAMITHCLHEHHLDPARVFVTGLSAGGAMANVLLATYPEVFAAGAVIAGLPYGRAQNVQEAMALMRAPHPTSPADLGALIRRAAPAHLRPRVAVWHGDSDHTVSDRNGADTARQWADAHGLSASPNDIARLPGRTRSTWRSPSGEALVELNIVRGLAHGTPLATTGSEGLGHSAPYMLEAGISSSIEIARFWELAPMEPSTGVALELTAVETAEAKQPEPLLGSQVLASLGSKVPPDVQTTIARALKTAGLL